MALSGLCTSARSSSAVFTEEGVSDRRSPFGTLVSTTLFTLLCQIARSH